MWVNVSVSQDMVLPIPFPISLYTSITLGQAVYTHLRLGETVLTELLVWKGF